MFLKWLQENDLNNYSFDQRLFPPASDREFWIGVTDAEHIRAAEELLGCDWPLLRSTAYLAHDIDGDRLAYETPHFTRRHQLITLFLGELAEHKGRFLPDICDGILAICEETYWGVSHHKVFTKKYFVLPDASDPYIDLFAAETAELLAVIHHILGRQLNACCSGILERMEYELDRRIVNAYLNHGDFWWMGKTGATVNNWNPWIISNILTVFLVMDLRKTRLHTGLQRMFEEIQRYYDAIPADGGCDEGCMYWTKAGGKILAFCEQLYTASGGRVNLYDDEKLRKMGMYEAKVYIEGVRFVTFADSSARLVRHAPEPELYLFGLRTGQQDLCALAATFKRARGNAPLWRGISMKSRLYGLIYARDIDAQPDFQPENTYVLPNLQVACMRSGDWYYAAKGGHNAESHNHNDVGSCIVYHKGQPVLIDAGSGVYTRDTFSEMRYSIWNMRSDWHNLPVINGCVQAPGRQFRADRFGVEEQRTEISYAGAYPQEARLQCALRTVDISKNGVTVTDSFSFTGEENSVQLHWLTALKPEITDGGVILGGKYLLKTGLPCTVEWKDFEGDANLFTSWQTQGLYRICFTADCGKAATFTAEIRSI